MVLAKLASTAGLIIAKDDGHTMTLSPGATEDIVVRAHRDQAETGYTADVATTSNRAGGTLRALPQKTEMITARLMEDEQAQTVNEALQNVASASVINNGGQGVAGFSVRGFAVAPVTNGLSNNATGTAAAPDLVADIEHIEVLEGPAAVLSGQGNEGGAVNVVTKRPSSDPLLNVTSEFASFGDKKIVVDGSDALTPDKKLSGRLVVEAEGAEHNYAGYAGRSEYLVAPSLRYKIEGLDAVIGTRWSRQFLPAGSFTTIDSATGSPYDVPHGPFGPKTQGITSEVSKYYYDVTKDVTDWLTFVSRGQYSRENTIIDVFSPSGYDLSPAEGGLGEPYLAVIQEGEHQNTKTITTDSYARVKFSLLGIKNTVSVGINTSHDQINDQLSTVQNIYASVFGSFPAVSLFNRSGNFTTPAYSYAGSYQESDSEFATYIQDLIEFHGLHIMASGRSDRTKTSLSYVQFPFTQSESAHATTPSVGAVYDITKNVSVYANYLQGFIPSYAVQYGGGLLPNNMTTNREIGIKTDFLNNKLTFDAGYYVLKQSNVLAADPIHPNYYIALGGEEAKGIELSLTGQIQPGLRIKATYTHADTTNLAPSPTNNAVPGQPPNRYSIYTSYLQSNGRFAGLGGALGIFGNSGSNADLYASTINAQGRAYVPRVPGSLSLDTNVFYTLGHIHLNLGIKNLLDAKVYGTAFIPTYIPILEGRQVVGTLSYHFF